MIDRHIYRRAIVGLCLSFLLPAGMAAEPAPVDAAPSRVTLRMKDAAPHAIFDAIAAQGQCAFTPNPADLWSRSAPPVSLDIANQPFWVAMKEACEKTGIYPTLVDRRKLTLAHGSRGWMDGPTIVSDGFLVLGVQAMRVNTIRLGKPDQVRRELSIQLAALPEPKLRVLKAGRAVLDEAVDENGQSLMNPAGGNAVNITGGPFAWNVELRLHAPPSAGQRIAKIKGSLKFAVQTSADVWTIDDVLTASNLKRTAGKHEFTFAGIAQQPNDPSLYIVRITAPARGRGDLESIQQLIHPACIDLLDDKGAQLIFRAWLRGTDKQQAEYAFHFAQPASAGPPARLVWQIPAATEEITVPFEFSNWPMP